MCRPPRLSVFATTGLLFAACARPPQVSAPTSGSASTVGRTKAHQFPQRFAGSSEVFAASDERVGTPFIEGLSASPAGDVIAWIENHRGRRNLWYAEGPAFEPVRITDFDRDDGRLLSNIVFDPTGKRLLFTRGAWTNAVGWRLNPNSDPEGAERWLWLVDLSEGTLRPLVEGHAAQFSPDGTQLLYRGGAGWVLRPLADEGRFAYDAPSAPLFVARGSLGDWQFSPDGTKLAFVSDRGDHSIVGVFDLGVRRLQWMAPSADFDFAPQWSPSGDALAFLRIQSHETTGSRDATTYIIGAHGPLQLMVADPGRATARPVLRSADPNGGFKQIWGDGYAWASDDTIVLRSERDGWSRLYRIGVANGAEQALTPADCETDEWTLRDGAVVLVGNCDDRHRRHLWSTSVDKGDARALTPGVGMQWTPVTTGAGTLAYVDSEPDRPPAIAVIAKPGATPRRIREPPTKASWIQPSLVRFRAADGLELDGVLLPGRGAAARTPGPAIVYAHGGPVRQMFPGWHAMEFYHHSYAVMQDLAERGYTVLYVNFRLGVGYGHAFRHAPDTGPYGVAELQDIVAAGRFLQARPEVDRRRIGIWGASYGGHLTGVALGRHSNLFAAGVDVCGVSKFREAGRRKRFDEAERKVAVASSVLGNAEGWRSPVLFIHGDDDLNVPFAEMTELLARLRELGQVQIETLVFPDEDHFFRRYASWQTIAAASARFFDAQLTPRR